MSTTRLPTRHQMTVGMTTALVAATFSASGGMGASPSASPAPGMEATVFASTVYPYTMTLPPGWTVTSVSPEDTGDLFRGPDASARVGSQGPVVGQTVVDRVAVNRADITAQGCTSDPAGDAPATLGGEAAIAWSYTCEAAETFALNAVHAEAGYRLSVTVPAGSTADGPGILAELASTFAFVTAPASPAAPVDLAAIDAQLQGTWRTEWEATDLWLAKVESVGLDPNALSGFVEEIRRSTERRQTIRFADDQLLEFVAIDRGPDELGSQATYRLIDANTIEAVSPDGVYRTILDFELRDDILLIDAIEDTDPLALIPETLIFETLPFTRVP